MGSRNKDGLSADAVHVNTHPRLDVIQVDVAVLGDEVDDAIFSTNLKHSIQENMDERHRYSHHDYRPRQHEGLINTIRALPMANIQSSASYSYMVIVVESL